MISKIKRITLYFVFAAIVFSIMSLCVFAADETVIVDLSDERDMPKYLACNFLWAFSREAAAEPPDEFVTPLKIGLHRISAGYTVSQYPRLNSLGIKEISVLSDVYRKDQGMPGDNDEWSTWDALITQVITGHMENNIYPIYDIWNEPDHPNHLGSRPRSQYYALWKRTYKIIRELNPNADIQGPEFYSIFPGGTNSAEFEDFLLWTKANDCVPDYIAWHFARNIVNEVSYMRQFCADNDISYKGLRISEYMSSIEENPGKVAWLVSQLERAEVEGLHAIWTQPGKTEINVGTLGDILVKTNGVFYPKGQWWVYKRYSEMEGKIIGSTQSSNIDLVASSDKNKHTARILIGNKGSFSNKSLDILLTGLSNFTAQRSVVAKIEKIPYNSNGVVTEPITVSQTEIPVLNGTATVNLHYENVNDAYYITVMPQISEVTELYDESKEQKVDRLNGITQMSVKTAVKNNGSTDKSVMVVAALFNESGKLSVISADTVYVSPNAQVFANPVLQLPENIQNYTLKVYIWDGYEFIMPLFGVKSFGYDDINVNISGIVTAGQGRHITAVLRNSDGHIADIGQTVSGAYGEYSFSFRFPHISARGSHTVAVSGNNTPLIQSGFIYDGSDIVIYDVEIDLEGGVE